MANLVLEGLHKRFGEVIALKSLDLHITSGEFVSFLGPSGCGKTTALRIVAGFERPDAGRVVVGGQEITHVPANRRDMGMVFQAYSLFPNMTALENVAFGLRVRRTAPAARAARASELLELVGLSAAATRYPHQLSGGQQQRVALARALAIQPSVLLLDEPLSALDATVRLQLRDEIRRIQSNLGITTLFVTHDQEEALSVSDRVVVLSQGQVEQVGAPAEIYGKPRTDFVARFIGTMNRLDGTVLGQGQVKLGGYTLPVEAAHDYSAGSNVCLLLRPEAIIIQLADQPSQTTATTIPGTVRVRTFQGAVTRLAVETPLGEMKVDLGSIDAADLGPGVKVKLYWRPDAPRLLDAAPAENQSMAAAPAPVSLA